MVTEKVILQDKQRFMKEHKIPQEKLQKAIDTAVTKLEKQILEHSIYLEERLSRSSIFFTVTMVVGEGI